MMHTDNSVVLKRYALAYIKKSGGNSDVKEFLRYFNNTRNLTWDEDIFAETYKEHTRLNSTNRHNTESRNDQHNTGNNGQTTDPQTTYIHVHNNRGLDFWDCLLLQCWINSLFGGRGHNTVNNITNISNGNTTHQSRKENKKESEDSRKLLALGIALVVVCVAFHVGMCFWYNSSKKAARKEEKIDYLDNKLKTFRNIEFVVGTISLAALIACAIYPVLPVWGLVILGVNSLVCFAGGLAFHMKHEKESDNIEKAEEAVKGYNTSPPPLSEFGNPSPSAPSYSGFNDSNVTGQKFGIV